jgi:uracil phosphoribosyltransferase
MTETAKSGAGGAHILNHCLINHKIALLRDEKTGTKQFRELVEEISMLVAYEALKDLPTREVTVRTPLEETLQRVVVENSVCIVPILRAGLGMVSGVHSLLPTAKVGHIGLYRDHETLEPHEYYCKLPDGIEDMLAILLDPMLATGGSASAAVSFLKARGCRRIKLMSIVGVARGIDCVLKNHPDVEIFCAVRDRELNGVGYILPGLGDAGDRLFGTK